jgi:hypothetical protein
MAERRARWIGQTARLAALSLLLAAGALCLASQALAQTACETTPATIERTALTEETPAGVGLEAEIDPHNAKRPTNSRSSGRRAIRPNAVNGPLPISVCRAARSLRMQAR